MRTEVRDDVRNQAPAVRSRTSSAVVVAGLRKSYGAVQAVRDVSFTVEDGEIFALLGPNGAGKTTTLEILEGFRTRDAGRVEVLGADPGDRATGRALREQIGLVLQDIAVEPYLTVRETLARNAGYYPAPRDVDEVIGLVGLTGQERRKVRALSGGQQRRLDLALGLIGDPRLLFLDEPTTGFDPNARRDAWQIVRDLRDAGTTIVLTTHYMDEAQALADRVAVMSGGRIVAEGPPSTIGGRDAARARIRFALPDGYTAADLPLPAVAGHGLVTVETAEPTEALHRADRLGPAARDRARPAHRGPGQPGGRLPAPDLRLRPRRARSHRPKGAPDEHRRLPAHRARRSNLALLWHQVRYEQLSFWRNPQNAIFTFAVPGRVHRDPRGAVRRRRRELVLLRAVDPAVLRAHDRRPVRARLLLRPAGRDARGAAPERHPQAGAGHAAAGLDVLPRAAGALRHGQRRGRRADRRRSAGCTACRCPRTGPRSRWRWCSARPASARWASRWPP